MTYKVVLSKDALRTLNRVPPATKRRLIIALDTLKLTPLDGTKLHGELEAVEGLE